MPKSGDYVDVEPCFFLKYSFLIKCWNVKVYPLQYVRYRTTTTKTNLLMLNWQRFKHTSFYVLGHDQCVEGSGWIGENLSIWTGGQVGYCCAWSKNYHICSPAYLCANYNYIVKIWFAKSRITWVCWVGSMPCIQSHLKILDIYFPAFQI